MNTTKASKYTIVCQHSIDDSGFTIVASNLRRAKTIAREHVETSYINKAQATILRMTLDDRPPYRAVCKYVNYGGRAVKRDVW